MKTDKYQISLRVPHGFSDRLLRATEHAGVSRYELIEKLLSDYEKANGLRRLRPKGKTREENIQFRRKMSKLTARLWAERKADPKRMAALSAKCRESALKRWESERRQAAE